MILVDTSIWINHLRKPNAALIALLDDGSVLSHPAVIGELALGGLNAGTFALLLKLPRALVATDDEVLRLIRSALVSTGVGYVDAQLIAAVRLTPECQLWARDKALEEAASALVNVYAP